MSIRQPAAETIHWGGVIKGAAIVTAVVVAAVSGYWVFDAGTGFVGSAIAGNTTANAFATAILNGLNLAATQLSIGISWAMGALGAIPGIIAAKLGLVGTITAAEVGAASGSLASFGAIAAASAAVPAAVHALSSTSFTADALPDTNTLTAHSGNMMGMHTATHATGHIAAEHTDSPDDYSVWTNRVKPKKSGYASHAEAIGASNPAPVMAITPRDKNFAAQLNADTENHDRALSK